MGWLFGSRNNEAPTQREIINAQKKEIKGYKATIEALQRQARFAREGHDDEIHQLTREHSRKIEQVEDEAAAKYRKLELTTDERVRVVKENCREEIDTMRDYFNTETDELNRAIKDVDIEVQSAELKLEKKHNEEKLTLERKVSKAEADAKVETQRADDAEAMVKAVVSLLNDYKEEHSDLIETIFTKVPEVKMDKFNINVEVPASTVHVNNGQKGGDQQKKS